MLKWKLNQEPHMYKKKNQHILCQSFLIVYIKLPYFF
jgi:hypothetical protein